MGSMTEGRGIEAPSLEGGGWSKVREGGGLRTASRLTRRLFSRATGFSERGCSPWSAWSWCGCFHSKFVRNGGFDADALRRGTGEGNAVRPSPYRHGAFPDRINGRREVAHA